MSNVSLIPVSSFDSSQLSKDDYVVFGGTFDPIHAGHVQAIRDLLGKFTQVIVAPTSQNPWKKDSATPLNLRCEMLRLVLEAEGLMGVTIHTGGYVYAEELVKVLSANLPGTLYWGVGADIADSVSNWRNWESLGVTTIVVPIQIPTHSTDVREQRTPIHPAAAEFAKKHQLFT